MTNEFIEATKTDLISKLAGTSYQNVTIAESRREPVIEVELVSGYARFGGFDNGENGLGYYVEVRLKNNEKVRGNTTLELPSDQEITPQILADVIYSFLRYYINV